MKIGLTGKLRSGKDTVADYLVENYVFKKFAFGNALKHFANEIFNINTNTKPREIYQKFGQCCREIEGDVWVRKCFESIRRWEGVYGNVGIKLHPVITDIRQPNEFNKCRAEGFVTIRVAASDDVRIERARAAGDAFDADALNHETEQHVDQFDVDYEVENNGRIIDLYEQIDVIMRELQSRSA